MKKIFLLTTYCLLLTTVLTGCATVYNPVTGKREITFINAEEEVAIGKNVAKEVLRQYEALEDLETQRYVQRVGLGVALASERKDIQYTFTVLDNKELNAFALPGGIVYINKGLVDILSEDELACVLAHEVGHIAARHAVKRMEGQFGYRVLLNIALYEVGQVDRGAAETITRTTDSVFGLILLGYSRKDELFADKLAVKYAHRAGYDPRGMASGLKKLQERSKEKGSPRAFVILRSHPYLSDRIVAVKMEAEKLQNAKREENSH